MEVCKARDSEGRVRNTPHDGECRFCGWPGNYEYTEISVKTPFNDVEWCPVCKGSGEVSGGVTWRDGFGEVRVRKNVFASEWILAMNELVPLWSIHICGICHGTGMNSNGISRV
jgi:hypothetical protein